MPFPWWRISRRGAVRSFEAPANANTTHHIRSCECTAFREEDRFVASCVIQFKLRAAGDGWAMTSSAAPDRFFFRVSRDRTKLPQFPSSSPLVRPPPSGLVPAPSNLCPGVVVNLYYLPDTVSLALNACRATHARQDKR